MNSYLQVISSSSPLSNGRLRIDGDQVVELDAQGRVALERVEAAVRLEVWHQERWAPLRWEGVGGRQQVVLDVDNPFVGMVEASEQPDDEDTIDRPIRRYALALFVVSVLFFLAVVLHYVIVEG